jgi:predicted DNA-binding transcriptional regulator YafY
MGRNSELIRQWTLLQQIATTRGQTIPKLATELSVSTRTIRRDLEALQVAGFPVYDETVHGSKFWRVDARGMGALARTGLTLSELAALYFSRAVIECFGGTALRNDIGRGGRPSAAASRLSAFFASSWRLILGGTLRRAGGRTAQSGRRLAPGFGSSAPGNRARK